MNVSDHVILVDEYDHPIGSCEKLAAHRTGQLHRAFSVFITRVNKGVLELLLQQRHPNKYHSGGLWANSCCSHPRVGEDTLSAAMRRVKEELGIHSDLIAIGSFIYHVQFENGLHEYEYDHVLLGSYSGTPDKQDEIPFDEKEIMSIKWMSIDDLMQDSQAHPDNYVAWLPKVLEFI